METRHAASQQPIAGDDHELRRAMEGIARGEFEANREVLEQKRDVLIQQHDRLGNLIAAIAGMLEDKEHLCPWLHDAQWKAFLEAANGFLSDVRSTSQQQPINTEKARQQILKQISWACGDERIWSRYRDLWSTWGLSRLRALLKPLRVCGNFRKCFVPYAQVVVVLRHRRNIFKGTAKHSDSEVKEKSGDFQEKDMLLIHQLLLAKSDKKKIDVFGTLISGADMQVFANTERKVAIELDGNRIVDLRDEIEDWTTKEAGELIVGIENAKPVTLLQRCIGKSPKDRLFEKDEYGLLQKRRVNHKEPSGLQSPPFSTPAPAMSAVSLSSTEPTIPTLPYNQWFPVNSRETCMPDSPAKVSPAASDATTLVGSNADSQRSPKLFMSDDTGVDFFALPGSDDRSMSVFEVNVDDADLRSFGKRSSNSPQISDGKERPTHHNNDNVLLVADGNHVSIDDLAKGKCPSQVQGLTLPTLLPQPRKQNKQGEADQ